MGTIMTKFDEIQTPDEKKISYLEEFEQMKKKIEELEEKVKLLEKRLGENKYGSGQQNR